MPTPNELAAVTAAVVARFEAASAVRDLAVGEGRQIVRLAANTVRAVHRGDYAEADRLASEAEGRLGSLVERLRPHPNLYWAGYVQDAMKEYAEARITRAVVTAEAIPRPEDLGVEDAPYLNALAEAASELRRAVLDRMRAGDLPEAERLFGVMDEVYAALVTVDFPDAVTGGLRRTTDQLRGVLERTRGDLTLTAQQQRLERALRAVGGTGG